MSVVSVQFTCNLHAMYYIYEMLYANYNTKTQQKPKPSEANSQKPSETKAKSQQKPTKANKSQQKPTKANKSQQKPTKANKSQRPKAKGQVGMQMGNSGSKMQQIARKTAPG